MARRGRGLGLAASSDWRVLAASAAEIAEQTPGRRLRSVCWLLWRCMPAAPLAAAADHYPLSAAAAAAAAEKRLPQPAPEQAHEGSVTV